MWPILLIAAGAAGIYALLKSEETEARNRWVRDRETVQRTVEEHRRNIERHIHEARQSYEFHVLTDMHFSSHRVADAAYKSLEDARVILDGFRRILGQARERRDLLEGELRRLRRGEGAEEIRTELRLISQHRRLIYDERDRVEEQRDALSAEVTRLNAQTAELKHAIRDRCGFRGAQWYDRLEARTLARRAAR